MSILLLILGLVLFISLVVLHELGHFLVARRNGVEVEEFGIGFPPAVWRKRIKSEKGDYDFTINLLPLGGFVRLKGEHDDDEREGSFGAARLKTKVAIMLAGVTVNLLTAFLMLTILAAIGIPRLIDNQFTIASDTKITKQQVLIAYIEPGSPASEAGVQLRDQLVSVQSGSEVVAVDAEQTLPQLTQRFAGQNVQLNIKRSGDPLALTTTLRSSDVVEASKSTDQPKGYLGVTPVEYVVQRSTWSAPIVGAGLIKQITTLTLQGLGSMVANLFRGDTAKATENVAGPVGIFVLLKDGSVLGYQFIMMIIAVISLTLAIMNVLPIPALDGGRFFVTLLFRALKKPLTQQREDLIHGAGFVALMILFVLITFVDVKRFF